MFLFFTAVCSRQLLEHVVRQVVLFFCQFTDHVT